MSVAILSTGDEIINGDIQNTTARDIAKHLYSAGIQTSFQLNSPDDEPSMTAAMQFLLKHCKHLIITGGLGPTSDDRTRFALGEYLSTPLVFFEECWEHIVKRHQKLGLTVCESNRQQAYFPKQARLLPNPNGSAYGCQIDLDGRFIFLLPGPPGECLPMFITQALPVFIKREAAAFTCFRWLLFGVSEGEIAKRIDAVLSALDCQTSYRWFYPYIELKVITQKPELEPEINALLKPITDEFTLSTRDKTALQMLNSSLSQLKTCLQVNDQATGGTFQAAISKPCNHTKLLFSNEKQAAPLMLTITGLDDYWAEKATTPQDKLHLHFYSHGKIYEKCFDVPVTPTKLMPYMVEVIAATLHDWLLQDEHLT